MEWRLPQEWLRPKPKIIALEIDLRDTLHDPSIQGFNQYSFIPGNNHVLPLEIDRFDFEFVVKRSHLPVGQQPMDPRHRIPVRWKLRNLLQDKRQARRIGGDVAGVD